MRPLKGTNKEHIYPQLASTRACRLMLHVEAIAIPCFCPVFTCISKPESWNVNGLAPVFFTACAREGAQYAGPGSPLGGGPK